MVARITPRTTSGCARGSDCLVRPGGQRRGRQTASLLGHCIAGHAAGNSQAITGRFATIALAARRLVRRRRPLSTSRLPPVPQLGLL